MAPTDESSPSPTTPKGAFPPEPASLRDDTFFPRRLTLPPQQPAAASDRLSVLNVSNQPPLWKRSSTEVLAKFTDVEMDVVIGRPFTKDQVWAAPATRVEPALRTHRRSLSIETARAAGATWAETDTRLGSRPGLSRPEYHSALSRQRRLGLVAADSGDPGAPEGAQR